MEFRSKGGRVNLTNPIILVMIFKAYELKRKKSISLVIDISSV